MTTEQKNRWADIRSMERKKALRYIWDYYKLWLIGIATAVFLLCYFVSVYLNRPQDTLLHVTFVNFYDDVSEKSEFYQNFVSSIEPLDQEGEITFDANVFFNLETSSGYTTSYYQKTVAYLEAKTTDAVICEAGNLEGLAQSGRLLDLSDERAAQIYTQYADRIVTTEYEGEDVPVGIRITDSPALAKMNGYVDDCYLAISAYTERIEMVERFLAYLLDGV